MAFTTPYEGLNEFSLIRVKKMSASKGAQLVPMGIPAEKLHPHTLQKYYQ